MKKESCLRKAAFGMGFVLLVVSAVMLQIPGTAGAQESGHAKLELPTVSHVGWMVKDIKLTVDFYDRAFGVSNGEVFEYKLSGTVKERGRELVHMSGDRPVEMALMTLWSFPMVIMKGHGETPLGLNHIAFMVDDVDPWAARLQDKGIEVLAEVNREDPVKGHVHIFTMAPDTMSGGLAIEFISWGNIPLGNREYFVKIDKNYVRDHNLEIPTLSHAGCLVKDIEQSVDFYERVLGVGPCKIVDHNVDNARVKGKQTKVSTRVAQMDLWGLPVVLIQPVSKGHLTEALEKRGEGFYSLGYLVNNLDTWVDRSREMGVEVLARIEREDPTKGRVRAATMEPDKMGGLTVEFLEWEKMP